MLPLIAENFRVVDFICFLGLVGLSLEPSRNAKRRRRMRGGVGEASARRILGSGESVAGEEGEMSWVQDYPVVGRWCGHDGLGVADAATEDDVMDAAVATGDAGCGGGSAVIKPSVAISAYSACPRVRFHASPIIAFVGCQLLCSYRRCCTCASCGKSPQHVWQCPGHDRLQKLSWHTIIGSLT
jgi:hypothetical protein